MSSSLIFVTLVMLLALIHMVYNAKYYIVNRMRIKLGDVLYLIIVFITLLSLIYGLFNYKP